MARKKKDQVQEQAQETPQAGEVQPQARETSREAREGQKKPVAYVYVGNRNRYEFEAEVDGEKRALVLWRNTVYRNLPDCEAVRELIEKGALKPIYA